MKIIFALLTTLGLFVGNALADAIHTIQLENRPSEEVIPIIQPMLGPNDSVTGQGFQLFIRTSDDNLEQIKQMISKLDTAAKLLLISVFQGDDSDLRALGVSGNFKFEDSRTDVSIGKSDPSRGGGDVSFSTGNASAGAQTLSTRGRLSDNPIHQLRITEGTQGYIETGESIPYFSGGYWLGGHGKRDGIVDGGVEYKDIHTGFYVLPRVHGQQVTLDVSPYKEKKSRERSGEFKTSSASTKITGPLGQWLPIGGSTEQTRSTSTGTARYSSTRGRDNKSIWIKADLVQ